MKRYTVVSENNDDIGIFHILNLLEEQDMEPGDSMDLECVERKFNLELPVPHYPSHLNTQAWFTEYGARYFREEIKIMNVLIDKYLDDFGYSFREISSGPKGEILYKDKYQAVYII